MAKKRKMRQAQVTFYGTDFMEIIDDYGPKALFYAGEVVQSDAERRVKVGPTGNLKRSGYVSVWGRTTFVRRMYWRKQVKPESRDSVVVAFSAPHAHLIEGGRRGKRAKFSPRPRSGAKALFFGGKFRAWTRVKRVAARPFLGPAIDATKDTLVEEMAKRYRSELERLLPGR